MEQDKRFVHGREESGTPLNPRKVFDDILWILKSGAAALRQNSIYHKFRGVRMVYSDICPPTLTARFCLSRIRLFVRFIRVLVRGKNTKIHVLLNERMQVKNVENNPRRYV